MGGFARRNDFGQSLARYRKSPNGGRWSLALVPPEGGHAALVEVVGPVAAYEVEEAPPLPPEPAAMPDSLPPPPPDLEGLSPAAFGLRRVGPGAAAPLAVESGLASTCAPNLSCRR